jgi:GTP 3',8-cyclase
MAIVDRLGRPLGNLRLSVTDRCNLRCAYCMPEKDYVWLPRRDILGFEEIGRLADVFGSLGVDRIRLTGGEPLVRHDLPALVRLLAAKPWLRDLAMTSNGVLLEGQAKELRGAGLRRITVSLDTLRPDRFRELTRFDELPRVLRGIEAAARAGFDSLKLDTVVIRGVNDDEIVPLIERAKEWGAEIRFIEYMDVGGATHWSRERVVSREGILRAVADTYGAVEPIREASSAGRRSASSPRRPRRSAARATGAG